MVSTKECRKCGKIKPLYKFKEVVNKGKVSGRRRACRDCGRWKPPKGYCNKFNKNESHKRAVKKYRESEHGKRKSRNSYLKRAFGITLEKYDRLFEEQNGLCAICGLPEKTIIRSKIIELGVDHNHVTKRVRGLLCSDCNTSIGKLKVDELGILNLQMAINYLKKEGD